VPVDDAARPYGTTIARARTRHVVAVPKNERTLYLAILSHSPVSSFRLSTNGSRLDTTISLPDMVRPFANSTRNAKSQRDNTTNVVHTNAHDHQLTTTQQTNDTYTYTHTQTNTHTHTPIVVIIFLLSSSFGIRPSLSRDRSQPNNDI